MNGFGQHQDVTSVSDLKELEKEKEHEGNSLCRQGLLSPTCAMGAVNDSGDREGACADVRFRLAWRTPSGLQQHYTNTSVSLSLPGVYFKVAASFTRASNQTAASGSLSHEIRPSVRFYRALSIPST